VLGLRRGQRARGSARPFWRQRGGPIEESGRGGEAAAGLGPAG
jgi:hypothetical protein